MCYHGNELQCYPKTCDKPTESQQEESVFKGKGGPTYASHLPKRHWDFTPIVRIICSHFFNLE